MDAPVDRRARAPQHPDDGKRLVGVLGAEFSCSVAQRDAVADLVSHPLGDFGAQHCVEQAFEPLARGERSSGSESP